MVFQQIKLLKIKNILAFWILQIDFSEDLFITSIDQTNLIQEKKEKKIK